MVINYVNILRFSLFFHEMRIKYLYQFYVLFFITQPLHVTYITVMRNIAAVLRHFKCRILSLTCAGFKSRRRSELLTVQ